MFYLMVNIAMTTISLTHHLCQLAHFLSYFLIYCFSNMLEILCFSAKLNWKWHTVCAFAPSRTNTHALLCSCRASIPAKLSVTSGLLYLLTCFLTQALIVSWHSKNLLLGGLFFLSGTEPEMQESRLVCRYLKILITKLKYEQTDTV